MDPCVYHRRSHSILFRHAFPHVLSIRFVVCSSRIIIKLLIPIDCWFGFIFWGMAYLTLYPGHLKWSGIWRTLETTINIFLIAVGVYILVAGTYVRRGLLSELRLTVYNRHLSSPSLTHIPRTSSARLSLVPVTPSDRKLPSCSKLQHTHDSIPGMFI